MNKKVVMSILICVLMVLSLAGVANATYTCYGEPNGIPDGVCEPPMEDETNCPEDCKGFGNWWELITKNDDGSITIYVPPIEKLGGEDFLDLTPYGPTSIFAGPDFPSQTCGNGKVDIASYEECDPPGSSCTIYGVTGTCTSDCECDTFYDPPFPNTEVVVTDEDMKEITGAVKIKPEPFVDFEYVVWYPPSEDLTPEGKKKGLCIDFPSLDGDGSFPERGTVKECGWNEEETELTIFGLGVTEASEVTIWNKRGLGAVVGGDNFNLVGQTATDTTYEVTSGFFKPVAYSITVPVGSIQRTLIAEFPVSINVDRTIPLSVVFDQYSTTGTGVVFEVYRVRGDIVEDESLCRYEFGYLEADGVSDYNKQIDCGDIQRGDKIRVYANGQGFTAEGKVAVEVANDFKYLDAMKVSTAAGQDTPADGREVVFSGMAIQDLTSGSEPFVIFAVNPECSDCDLTAKLRVNGVEVASTTQPMGGTGLYQWVWENQPIEIKKYDDVEFALSAVSASGSSFAKFLPEPMATIYASNVAKIRVFDSPTTVLEGQTVESDPILISSYCPNGIHTIGNSRIAVGGVLNNAECENGGEECDGDADPGVDGWYEDPAAGQLSTAPLSPGLNPGETPLLGYFEGVFSNLQSTYQLSFTSNVGQISFDSLDAYLTCRQYTPAPGVPQDTVSCGDTITAPGTYTLTQDLTNTDPTAPCLTVQASGVTIDGAGYSIISSGPGIYANGVSDLIVDNLLLEGPGREIGEYKGIEVVNSNYLTIQNSAINNFYVGAVVTDTDHIDILHNSVSYGYYAMAIACNDVWIDDVQIEDMMSGGILIGSDDKFHPGKSVTQAEITKITAGAVEGAIVALGDTYDVILREIFGMESDEAIYLKYCDNVDIDGVTGTTKIEDSNNVDTNDGSAEGSSGIGIDIIRSSLVTVSNWNLFNFDYAINVIGSTDVTLLNNIITSSDNGVYVDGASAGVYLNGNYMKDNTYDIYNLDEAYGDANTCANTYGYADDGQTESCDSYPSSIKVEAVRHTIGTGSHPNAVKEPLAGLTLHLYDGSAGSCAGDYSASWQYYPDIVDNCLPLMDMITDANGYAEFAVDAGDYVIIAEDGADKHLGTPVGADDPEWIDPGYVSKKLHQIVKPDNSKVAGKSKKYLGSEIYVIEPEYIIWDDVQETYPFIFESQDSWGVDVSVAPPEGYEADHEVLGETTPEYKVVQFTVTEVGSVPDYTDVDMNLVDHKGKKTKVKDKIGIKLSKKLAKEKDVKIDKYGTPKHLKTGWYKKGMGLTGMFSADFSEGNVGITLLLFLMGAVLVYYIYTKRK